MNERDFLDTNVLVYSLDDSNPHKHKTAKTLVDRAVQGEAVISVQVQSELASVLLQKYASTYSNQDALAILDSLKPIHLIRPDFEMVRRAVEAHGAYGVNFYDGMIIAAAERAGSKKIYSEDMNAGQKYFGIEVVDPFRT